MPNTPTHYTLNEYGLDWLEFTSLSVNDEPLIFDSWESAVDMAKWMLEGGAEPNQLPLVTILGWDADPAPQFLTDDYLDIPAYACGWVVHRDGKVTVHEGDYENDEELWAGFPKPVKAEVA